VYLLHWPMLLIGTYLSMWANVSHARVPHCAWLAGMVALGVLPGLLLHRYVEAQLLRLGKRRPAPAAAAPPSESRRAA
jgi:peptidoglycan/LPS O-acetylase OafA/YrhL